MAIVARERETKKHNKGKMERIRKEGDRWSKSEEEKERRDRGIKIKKQRKKCK